MKQYFVCTLLLFFILPSFAQKGLAGLWEGTLTYREKEYKLEIFIKVFKKGKLEGKTYIYQTENDVIEAAVDGKLHSDRSLNLYDLKVDYTGPSEQIEVFPKNYQLSYKRSIWELTLEGFWQEQVPHGINEKSKLGRIFLKKAKPKPSKA